jgi:two-component system phosphate regulon sensor histidine kinase PhoR
MQNDFPALDKDLFISLSLVEDQNQQKMIVVLMLNRISVTHNVIEPKLREVAGDQFYVNIFANQKINPDYSISDLTYDNIMLEKQLWIFPDLTIGIRSQGQDISEITQDRFNKSLLLIFILNAVLVAGAIFIYKNIGKVMRLAQLKSDFVSNVSHELRTPLSLIRMYAETLEMGRIPSEEKKIQYYKNISQESERLTHLINNILNFSRMESGRKDYKFSDNELNTLTKNIIQTYNDHIKESGFELEVNYNENDIKLKLDDEAISEALINLLDNSIKYSDKEKKIYVSTGENNGTAFIEVKDKGIGIAAENYDKIFEKFYRESTNNIHNTKGSGLGLSIVKHIMDAHDGWVKVSSEQGRGSSFTLVFPKPKKHNN